jgi:ribonuclease VapC
VIAVDTSALMAIVLAEPEAQTCAEALEEQSQIIISAVTVVEALTVALRRDVFTEMTRLIDGLDFDVLPVTAETAKRVARAYAQWGRRRATAGLNFGDCFAYDAAKSLDCALLYVGDDFCRTDVRAARS